MATLGFYRNTKSDEQVTIHGVHVNVWILPTRGRLAKAWRWITRRGTYRTYVDIGVRFSAAGLAPTYLEFLPPADSATLAGFSDLSREVLDPKVSDLIFGSSVRIDGNIIAYRQSDFDITETVLQVDDLSAVSTQRYRVRIAGHVMPKATELRERYYVRFRYECDSRASMLYDKGWAFAKRGWMFDLRINDVRETIDLPPNSAPSQLMDIDSCYVFLVTPASFVPVLASPALQYTRLLELNTWKDYLASCVGAVTDERSAIYYWRLEQNKAAALVPAVTTYKPMRTYMHLHREFGLAIFLLYGIGIIALPWLSHFLEWLGKSAVKGLLH